MVLLCVYPWKCTRRPRTDSLSHTHKQIAKGWWLCNHPLHFIRTLRGEAINSSATAGGVSSVHSFSIKGQSHELQNQLHSHTQCSRNPEDRWESGPVCQREIAVDSFQICATARPSPRKSEC
jgi:hypothetical protein